VSDIAVEIYFGPHSWFEGHIDVEKDSSFLDLIYDEAAEHRQVVVVDQRGEAGDGDDKPAKRKRLDTVYVFSADYASVTDHVITNFAGYIRRLNPKRLLLQNPPTPIVAQVERVLKATTERYAYPTVTTEVLRELDNGFAKAVIGQDAVKNRLLAALYPLSKGQTRPVVAMFYGPSGVGKTETAKYVNKLLGGELMRQQFSMFHSDKFGDYIFGGTHSEASFARDLLDRTSGVILLDEFDKAHSVFHSAFYELFDGGAFKDKNYALDVGPAVIICTSNYLSESEVRNALGDALYSRFDLVVEFQRLSPESLLTVVDLMVDDEVKALSGGELELLDVEDLRGRLRQVALKATNVRNLRKLVAEVFSSRLVRAVLEADDTAEPVPGGRDVSA
jgi:ATP-dependent Clp protease ATP-binding subunit ClpA